MADPSPNMQQVQIAINQMNRINQLVTLYDAGKVTLIDGLEVNLSAPQIAQLKSSFVTAKQGLKAALDAISA